MKRELPTSVYNPISMFGAAVALITFCLIVFLMLIDLFREHTSPYLGIVAFIILPSVLVIGLIAIPVGMYFERKRRLRGGKERSHFYLDLSKSTHRRATMIFLSGSIIFLMATAVGSYKAYEFTESVYFCGQTCHVVMEPEFTAYQVSPHARVTCAECHVGKGADWYVRSKLSGMYQLYAVTFDLFPRPIPTPVENLRPAQATCEQCHWPDKFHGAQAKTFTHFRVDEENSRWDIRMLIKTGGADGTTGRPEGIHWHIANKVEYIATDKRRQEIAWVRVTDNEGNVREYTNEENPLEPDELSQYEPRRIDCIDCHNRPTHIFHAPSRSVNQAMAAGLIAPSLPSAKRIAIETLIADYATRDSAKAAIGPAILQAYEDEYPEILESRAEDLEKMIAAVKEIYHRNFFPEMKVRWDAYPDNIGHFLSPGCYRCHNGSFTSDDGETITHDCNSCHVILSQGGIAESQMIAPEGLEFKHPEDIDEAWREMVCSECHTGTSQL